MTDAERARWIVSSYIRGKNPLETHEEMAQAIFAALGAARAEERAEIVKWLRDESAKATTATYKLVGGKPAAGFLGFIADWIEAGDHSPPKKATST